MFSEDIVHKYLYMCTDNLEMNLDGSRINVLVQGWA